MRLTSAGALLVVVSSLVPISLQGALAAESKREAEPAEVVKRFWQHIKANEVDRAIALHTFSQKTKHFAKALQAEYSKWSTPYKEGEVKVTFGASKVAGRAAVVLITCDEGQTSPKPEPVFLVRKKDTWKLLMPGLPGDAPAHELDADTVASMKALKTWVAKQPQE
jgi:hypothetical protein